MYIDARDLLKLQSHSQGVHWVHVHLHFKKLKKEIQKVQLDFTYFTDTPLFLIAFGGIVPLAPYKGLSWICWGPKSTPRPFASFLCNPISNFWLQCWVVNILLVSIWYTVTLNATKKCNKDDYNLSVHFIIWKSLITKMTWTLTLLFEYKSYFWLFLQQVKVWCTVLIL